MSHSEKRKQTSDEILCTIHDDWAGKPNKTEICDKCLEEFKKDRLTIEMWITSIRPPEYFTEGL